MSNHEKSRYYACLTFGIRMNLSHSTSIYIINRTGDDNILRDKRWLTKNSHIFTNTLFYICEWKKSWSRHINTKLSLLRWAVNSSFLRSVRHNLYGEELQFLVSPSVVEKWQERIISSVTTTRITQNMSVTLGPTQGLEQREAVSPIQRVTIATLVFGFKE